MDLGSFITGMVVVLIALAVFLAGMAGGMTFGGRK